MIRIEHANLVSNDLEATLKFLTAALPEWQVRGRGETEWFGTKRNWLHFGSEDYYITLNEGNQDSNRDLTGQTPGLAHIGFCVDDVDLVVARLKNEGYEIATIGADHPYRKNVYFVEPSGFEFEFIQYLSTAPEQKNMVTTHPTPEIRQLVVKK